MSSHIPAMMLPLPAKVIAFFSEIKEATSKLKAWDLSAEHVRSEHRDAKKFTPDGRMIGDVGEVLAERYFAIKLQKNQKAGYDAVLEDDESTKIEIKMTRNGIFQFRKIPDYVIALAMQEDAHEVEVVYNGPGSALVKGVSAIQSNVEPTSGDHYTMKKAVNVKPHEVRKLMPKSEKSRVPLRPAYRARS